MQKLEKGILTRNHQFNSPNADNTVFNKSALDDTFKGIWEINFDYILLHYSEPLMVIYFQVPVFCISLIPVYIQKPDQILVKRNLVKKLFRPI